MLIANCSRLFQRQALLAAILLLAAGLFAASDVVVTFVFLILKTVSD